MDTSRELFRGQLRRVFRADIVSTQSIYWQQLESGDGDDVGFACVIESMGRFETDATVDAEKELDQQRCSRY